MNTEKATFGAGCFWGVEAAFAAIPGVKATAVGYEEGSSIVDLQGRLHRLHRPREVVELDFDPAKVSFPSSSTRSSSCTIPPR